MATFDKEKVEHKLTDLYKVFGEEQYGVTKTSLDNLFDVERNEKMKDIGKRTEMMEKMLKEARELYKKAEEDKAKMMDIVEVHFKVKIDY
jgi:hypothetical protein